MGHTTWTASASTVAYQNLTRGYATSGVGGTALSDREIFKSHACHKNFDPKQIKVRESCDSDANPNSTPIIFGLDVTGSMGFIPSYLVREGFGPLIEQVISKQPISDPHVMMMALGDLTCDRSSLQASQFEADIRIVEQLTQLHIEGGGGGNGWESYDLAWLFAGLKTKIDSWDKRGKRGYLFTFGDEPPPPNNHKYSLATLKELLGDKEVVQQYTTLELLQLAMERWAVFHVIVEQGNYARGNLRKVESSWGSLFEAAGNGSNLIRLSDYKQLPAVITAVLQVAEGQDIEQVLAEQTPEARDVVAHALAV